MINIEKKTLINPQNDLNGFVHTLEVELLESEIGECLFEQQLTNSVVGMTGEWIGHTKDKGKKKTLKYNPNDYVCQIFHPNNDGIAYGHCNSIEKLQQGLNTWASWMGLNRENIHVVRLDFAFDCPNPKDERHMCRVYEAIVHAFAASHRTHKRDQYREVTLLTRELKSNKAIYGRISMEAYNRTMKHARSRVKWRFEIRYGESGNNRPSAPLSPLAMLACLKKELSDLKDKLPQLEEVMNRHLYNDYKAKFVQRSIPATRNEKFEFVRSNSNRFFTRRQLVKFLMKVDPALSLKKAQEKADGQTENHPEDFCMINEDGYKAMLSDCIAKIEHYVSPEKRGYISVVPEIMKDSITMQLLDHEVQAVKADSVKNDSKYNARSTHTTTLPIDNFDERLFESLCFNAELYPDDYSIPRHTSEPWPPFGQPSFAIGRTPPPGVSI